MNLHQKMQEPNMEVNRQRIQQGTLNNLNTEGD